nr:ABC transporter permease [Mucilaginibacter sp. L294]
MIKTYFKIAFRNLVKHKFYSAINIFGLSLGIGCCIILFQFISYHLSFDRYHHDAKQLYRIVNELRVGDGSVEYVPGNSIALGNAVKARIPQIKEVGIISRILKLTVAVPQTGNVKDKLFAENETVALTSPSFFSLFDYEWEQGDKNTALNTPNTVVLSHSIAQKYFGSQDVVGRTILTDSKTPFKITGIVKDHPANTDIKTDIFLSIPSLKEIYPQNADKWIRDWGWVDTRNNVYVSLAEGTTSATINAMLKKMDKNSLGPEYTFLVQPLSEIHFDMRYRGVIQKSLLATLGIIGALLAIIACVNFINMATAQSFKRAKEIGTRKVLGSTPSAIFKQFITETSCIAVFAALLAVGYVLLVLPVLNNWLQTQLSFNFFTDIKLSAFLVMLLATIIITAGTYPALILSRFKPVNALKNQVNNNSQSAGLARKGLIVFQNVIAQVLIIGTILITMQVKFLKSANPGFNKDAIVVVPVPDNAKTKTDFLRNQLLSRPGIESVTYCDRPAASARNDGGSVKFDNREWENFTGFTILADADFAKTFGLKIIAGRNIAESDTASEYLVNETMVKRLGIKDPQQIIGHKFVAGGITNNPGIVVGVMKDFHAQSMYAAIPPESISAFRHEYRFAAIKINANNVQATLENLKRDWQAIYPENVFEYTFQDEQINDFYQKEELLNRVIRSSASVAIFISCLGLLGLISLITAQRTKEIGIRKVLGASVAQIMALISKDFLKLVLLSAIVAIPLGWLLIHTWLQNFAYHIQVPIWVFVSTVAISVVIAFVVTCIQSVKAAVVNPVKSLRSE